MNMRSMDSVWTRWRLIWLAVGGIGAIVLVSVIWQPERVLEFPREGVLQWGIVIVLLAVGLTAAVLDESSQAVAFALYALGYVLFLSVSRPITELFATVGVVVCFALATALVVAGPLANRA